MSPTNKIVQSVDVDQGRELIHLCRAGRLYELEKWITAGKSLDISSAKRRGRQKGLLEIAVETGFHSLVELIAKHETNQASKDAALAHAVSAHRLDLVELLLANGAEIKSIPLLDVLLTWDPKVIRFFLDRGADPIVDRPFAEAFGAKIRTALRPFLEYKQAHPEIAGELQEQLNCALRHFCHEGDLKWVSLLIWAGGDPRSRGPCLYQEYTEDPEGYTSGIEQACHSESPDVLKRLKPDATRDNLSELLYAAAISGKQAMLKYLLELGANPNDKANGGSSALDTALWRLSITRITPYASKDLKSRYTASSELDCVRELLAHGAVWNPDDNVTCLRRTLLEYEPELTIELLQMFRKHNACPAETVHRLLGTPRMKQHLAPQTAALLRLGIRLEGAFKRRRQSLPKTSLRKDS